MTSQTNVAQHLHLQEWKYVQVERDDMLDGLIMYLRLEALSIHKKCITAAGDTLLTVQKSNIYNILKKRAIFL